MHKDNFIKVVIPARKNSKRFPNKNLVNLGGTPLISHSIEYALKYFDKDDIWVNSDDERILNIAGEYNVRVYQRSEELATDFSSTAEVLKNQIEYFKNQKIRCDHVLLLQPTNPLRPNWLMDLALNEYFGKKANSLTTFSELNKKFGSIIEGKFTPSNYKPGQRMQDLIPDYFENGLIYLTSADRIMNLEIITEDVLPLIIDDITSTVDIDEELDLMWAEFVYNNFK